MLSKKRAVAMATWLLRLLRQTWWMCGAVTDCNQQQKTLKIVAESLTNSSKKPETPHKLTAGCYSEYSTFYSAQISQDRQCVVKLEVRSIVQKKRMANSVYHDVTKISTIKSRQWRFNHISRRSVDFTKCNNCANLWAFVCKHSNIKQCIKMLSRIESQP